MGFPAADRRRPQELVGAEDHPVDYLTFTGTIPEGNDGAGVVRRWDIGTYEPIGDPAEGLNRGALKFRLHGKRLKGEWRLFKMKGRTQGDKPRWLLQKSDDELARPGRSARKEGIGEKVGKAVHGAPGDRQGVEGESPLR